MCLQHSSAAKQNNCHTCAKLLKKQHKLSRYIFAEYQHKKGKYINSKLQIIIPIIIITMKTAIIKKMRSRFTQYGLKDRRTRLSTQTLIRKTSNNIISVNKCITPMIETISHALGIDCSICVRNVLVHICPPS